jgi:NAD+ synthase
MPKIAQSLVVGISGGIDSSLVSTIPAKTGLKTIVLSMSIKQIKNQDDLNKLHCNWLLKNFKNIEYLNIELDEVF